MTSATSSARAAANSSASARGCELDLGVEQHRPDPLPRRRAARLAGHHDLRPTPGTTPAAPGPPAFQGLAEQLELGRLAGPLDPLEGDQAARVTHRTHPGVRR